MKVNYTAGPTAAKFHASRKIVRGFMGPVGNGKSVACIMEMLRISMEQWPNNKRVRKTRWAIVRNTLPELRTTTLKTWKAWIPERFSPVVMNPMITTTLIQPIKHDNTFIEMEVFFVALDKPDDVEKLLGMELTGVFINEAREIPYAVVKAARERIGRYPSRAEGYVSDKDYKAPAKPCRRKVLLMDTNPPDTDHWWYQLAEEGCLRKADHKAQARKETKRIFDFFKGPSPLLDNGDGTYSRNPKAENIKNLDGGYEYYEDMIAGNDADQINVQVLGNYGTIKTGKPVYPEFSDRIHIPEQHFMPIEDVPIALGWDFGLTPACVIGQLTDTGQARIIAELVSDDMDVRQFARDVVKPFLVTKLPHSKIAFSFGDPSGSARGEGEGKSAINILNDAYVDDGNHNDTPLDMGFVTEEAPTNDPTRRRDAVKVFLTKMVAGGEPGFLLDKRCHVLRKGFNGGYCYKRVNVGGVEDRYRDVPDKNGFSHSHDALQYLCLGFTGGYIEHSELELAYDYEVYDDPHSTGYW